jgi:acetolactate synthase-1/2/3 large subunit
VTRSIEGHGGELALAALHPHGVQHLFTLSGGHIFPFYDAAVKRGDVQIVDVRHEQTATFAAEGMAKLTRGPGVAVLTAGPGVTNGMSAIATASFNGAPVIVLAGRAGQARWGAGSLQEIDHVPFVAPLVKHAATVTDPSDIARDVNAAVLTALAPHRGPVFLDFPIDVIFAPGKSETPDAALPTVIEPDADAIARVAKVIADAKHPALVVGSDVYWARGEDALRAAAEALRIPVFMNGMGRGLLPPDHELAFNRTRGLFKDEADAVIVAGTPLDFRLRFGSYGNAKVVHLVDAPSQVAGHVQPEVTVVGDLARTFALLAEHAGTAQHEDWITHLREIEEAGRSADRDLLDNESDPIHPARIYGEVLKRLDKDAVVVCDGGDFASYAGKFVDVHQPGGWLDTGPYGCLGSGPGHAIAARLARPDKQVVMFMGDGAFGFAGMDFDSMVRHNLPVVAVIGNNGIWGLEKHPMQAMYGYDVAADLQPGCRYDKVVEALGGAGEVVERPADIGPALDRAFRAGVPYVVNVLTDPANQYPRSSNLG